MAHTNFGYREREGTFRQERDRAFVHCSLEALLNTGAASDRRPMPNRLVRAIQAARRRRDALFGPELFADPAWDMLLELYALHLEEKRISVSSLCIAACVPATTALRWVAKIEEDGLAVRNEDSEDGRRTWIELSSEGVERMGRYFDSLTLPSI